MSSGPKGDQRGVVNTSTTAGGCGGGRGMWRGAKVSKREDKTEMVRWCDGEMAMKLLLRLLRLSRLKMRRKNAAIDELEKLPV